jgi:chromosome segregation ATPase
MSDVVVEKLTQKVSNFLEEVSEVNMLIRRQEPTRETLNKINERVDAIAMAIGQIEKGLKLDDSRLRELEEQTKSLKQTLASFGNSISGLAGNVDTIRTAVMNIMSQINDLRERLEVSDFNQFRWLIILGAAQLVFFVILLVRH